MNKWIIGCLVATFAAVAQADLLALWENDALSGNEAGPIAANSLGANVDSADMSRGAGATAVAYNDTLAMRHGDSASLADAIANDRYISISASATSGYEMNLTNVFLRLEANNITSGRQVALLSDATGLSDGDELWSDDLYDGGSGPGQFSTHDIALDGIAALQGLQDVEFRLYHWGSSSQYNATGVGRGYQTNGSDDVVLSGTLAVVPEPATFALLGLGLLGMAVNHRRHSV